MPIHLKNGGIWKQAKGVYVKDGGTWKPAKKVYIKDQGIWKSAFAAFPNGIILPYNDAGAIPTGFTRFAAADGRMLLGAGGTYAIGASGGSDAVSIASTTTTQGGHIGPGATATYSYQGGSNANNTDVNTRGSHNHTFTGSGTVVPPVKNIVLVKATQDIAELPANVGVFKHTAGGVFGFNISAGLQDRYMRGAKADVTLAGSASASVAVSTVTSGTHAAHHTLQGSPYSYYASPIYTAGGHTHTASFSGTVNPTYRYLKLYLAATASTPVPTDAVIGMWESSTPPDGWLACDGTNGTPDLRDYFVKITESDASVNTTGGSGSIAFSGSFSATPVHNHGSSNLGSIFTFTGYHQNNFQMETHTGSQTVSFLPPYYALMFIMRQP
jgi:hypothetical protein